MLFMLCLCYVSYAIIIVLINNSGYFITFKLLMPSLLILSIDYISSNWSDNRPLSVVIFYPDFTISFHSPNATYSGPCIPASTDTWLLDCNRRL